MIKPRTRTGGQLYIEIVHGYWQRTNQPPGTPLPNGLIRFDRITFLRMIGKI